MPLEDAPTLSGDADPAADAALAASWPWIELLRQASQAQIDYLQSQPANGPPDGSFYTPPDIILPGGLIIPVQLTLVLLNVTIVGDIAINGGGALDLFGVDLRMRNPQVRPGENQPPVANAGRNNSRIQLQGRLELQDLHSLRLPGGLDLTALPNRGSRLHAESPPLVATIEKQTPHLNGLVIAPSARFFMNAGPASRFVVNNSELADLVRAQVDGQLVVRNSLLRDSAQMFVSNNRAGQSITSSSVQRVNTLYSGNTNNDLTVSGNTLEQVGTAVTLINSNNARLEGNTFLGVAAPLVLNGGANLVFRNNQVTTPQTGLQLTTIAGAALDDNRFEDVVLNAIVANGLNSASISRNTFLNRNDGNTGTSTVTVNGGSQLTMNDNTARLRRGMFLNGITTAAFNRNDLRFQSEGVILSGAGTFTVEDNVVRDMIGIGGFFFPAGSTTAIQVSGGTLSLARNQVVNGTLLNGIILGSVAASVRDNVVTGTHRGLLWTFGSGSVVNNDITSNTIGGIEMSNVRPATVEDNVVADNGGPGIFLGDSTPAVRRNLVTNNGRVTPAALRGGIELLRSPATDFDDNVMEDNAFGVSIPYDSKATLLVAQRNEVNGFNIDGTVTPAEQVYWIGPLGCAGGLTLVGHSVDPSNGGQFIGVLNIQGSVTLYDCDSVLVQDAVLPANTHGVFARGTTGLTVEGGTFIGNNVPYHRGLNNPEPFPVLSGAVFAHGAVPLLVHGTTVRDSEAGIHVRTSIGEVRLNDVRSSDIGILGKASNSIFDENTVVGNRIGLDLEQNAVDVSSNNVTSNTQAGMILRSASPIVSKNTFTGNGPSLGGVGLQLIASSPQVQDSTIQGSDTGVAMTASGPVLQNLTVKNNRIGIGASFTSTPFITNDTLVNNVFGVVGSSSGVTITGSTIQGEQGLVMTGGSFNLQRSTISGGFFGLNLQTTSGEMKNTTLTGLVTAIVMSQSSVTFIHCDVNDNFFAMNATGSSSGVISACNVQGNDAGGLRFATGTQMTVRQSNINGNVNFGAQNQDATVFVDARSNWWGAAGGPNSAGADATVGNVFATPFLTAVNTGAGVQP